MPGCQWENASFQGFQPPLSSRPASQTPAICSGAAADNGFTLADDHAQTSMDRMLAALVPVVTLVLATVVGIVILAVLSPIYDLTSVIG